MVIRYCTVYFFLLRIVESAMCAMMVSGWMVNSDALSKRRLCPILFSLDLLLGCECR